MKNDTFFVEKCRDLIEAKLAWGKSSEWQNQDFENFSTELYEKTNYTPCLKLLQKIDKLELSEFVSTESQQAFIRDH